ncbi:MAG: hypothetical protein V4850_17415 [Myxococcota bacterium]
MRPLLFVLPLLAGCGAFDSAIGCDFREGSSNDPEPRCQERTGVQATGFDVTCEGIGAIPVEGGCPTEGIVAGCDITAAGTTGEVIDWYYAPETLETVTANCTGGTVIEG